MKAKLAAPKRNSPKPKTWLKKPSKTPAPSCNACSKNSAPPCNVKLCTPKTSCPAHAAWPNKPLVVKRIDINNATQVQVTPQAAEFIASRNFQNAGDAAEMKHAFEEAAKEIADLKAKIPDTPSL